jgi:hypothetical protein
MATELFPFTVTFTNGNFEIFETTNGALVATFPDAQLVIKTHPTIGNFYYMGTTQNAITLDFTQCTNLTVASRKAQIDAILALGSGTLGTVTIGGPLPLPVSLSYLRTNIYSLSATAAASSDILILRGNGSTTNLINIAVSTDLALSSGLNVTLVQGITVTGGTWATPAGVGASLIQQNTGGTNTGGSNEVIIPFNNAGFYDLKGYGITYPTLTAFKLVLTQTEIGHTTVAVTWTE